MGCCAIKGLPCPTPKPQLHEVHNILLLGTGGSGKTTFFQQLECLYAKPRSRDQMKQYRPIIFENTIEAMKTILTDGFRTLNESIPAELQAKADYILGIEKNAKGKYNLTPQIGTAIESLFEQELLVKQAFTNRAEYHLCDSAEYFLKQVKKLAAASYIPRNPDVFRSQAPTTDVCKKTYNISNSYFAVTDVGGQRQQRKKWDDCLQDAKMVLFMVDLSSYDKVLSEDNTGNRLEEAIELFGNIVNSSGLQETTFILCFNKDDIFVNRIETKDLRNDEKNWFTDYNGGCDQAAAYKHILDKFVSKCEDKSKTILARRTVATDTRDVECLFENMESFLSDGYWDPLSPRHRGSVWS